MKKALSILTAGCLAVSLAACGSTAASSAASAADSTASSAAESTAASDTAVGDFRRNAVAIGLECKIIVRQRERCARAGQFFPAAPFRRLSAGGQNGGQCDENQFFHFSKF